MSLGSRELVQMAVAAEFVAFYCDLATGVLVAAEVHRRYCTSAGAD